MVTTFESLGLKSGGGPAEAISASLVGFKSRPARLSSVQCKVMVWNSKRNSGVKMETREVEEALMTCKGKKVGTHGATIRVDLSLLDSPLSSLTD